MAAEIIKSHVQQSLEDIQPVFEALPTQADREAFIVGLIDKMGELGDLSPKRAHELGEVFLDMVHRPDPDIRQLPSLRSITEDYLAGKTTYETYHALENELIRLDNAGIQNES